MSARRTGTPETCRTGNPYFARSSYPARSMSSRKRGSSRSARSSTSSRARGHDVAQVLLGLHAHRPRATRVAAYYRSRPLLLALGLSVDDALASTMRRAGGMSRRPRHRRRVQPAEPRRRLRPARLRRRRRAVHARRGWAQALVYRGRSPAATTAVAGSIAVALGGEASTATNGFWAALTIATTAACRCCSTSRTTATASRCRRTSRRRAATSRPTSRLPQPADPRRRRHRSARGGALIEEAVAHVRGGEGPALLRLPVPRL